MYVIAIIGDVLGAIPFVNFVSDFLTMLALGIVGAATGVNLYSADKIGLTLVAGVIKMVFGFVPAWTIRVYLAKRNSVATG